jgi:hypothetical protein
MVSSTSRCTPADFTSHDPDPPDPIWELVERYRRICREKNALQEEILRTLDERERGVVLEVERARLMALAAMRPGTTAAECMRRYTWVLGNHGQGERPAIADLDGPREDPIRNGDVASCGVRPDRLAPVGAAFPAAMPSQTSSTSLTPAALMVPDVGPSSLPADGSVFAKYDEMISTLRTRSPPITLSFIPREEIPWPLLPSDGVFPVAVSRTRQIELDEVAEFAAGYALWRGKPFGKTLNILLGHWISMDKRLRKASENTRQESPEASSDVSETLRWIANVRSRLFSIVAEQGM